MKKDMSQDPLKESFAWIMKGLDNVESFLRDLQHPIVNLEELENDLSRMESYLAGLEKIKPKCNEKEANVKWEVFSQQFLQPYLHEIREMNVHKLEQVRKSMSDLQLKEKELLKHELFMDMLARLDDENTPRQMHLMDRLRNARRSLTEQTRALKQLDHEMERLTTRKEAIQQRLKELESLHEWTKDVREKYKELRTGEGELRILEEEIPVRRCIHCGLVENLAQRALKE